MTASVPQQPKQKKQNQLFFGKVRGTSEKKKVFCGLQEKEKKLVSYFKADTIEKQSEGFSTNNF